MILGVIPARSGSKSIKDKNIRPLNGRPLMVWSIKAGLNCRLIDKLVVSTDSQKYAEIAKKHGAAVIIRPKELAQDETPMLSVLQHAVRTYQAKGEEVELVVLLDPTSPLRTDSDIKACLQLIKQPNTDSVVTVIEAEHNPFFVMGTINDQGYWQYPLTGGSIIASRQNAPTVYRLNAAVYVIKKEILMAGKIFTNKTRVIIMPPERSVHIDSELDFQLAEFLLKEGYVKLDY